MIWVQPADLMMYARVKWDHVDTPLSRRNEENPGLCIGCVHTGEPRIYDRTLMNGPGYALAPEQFVAKLDPFVIASKHVHAPLFLFPGLLETEEGPGIYPGVPKTRESPTIAAVRFSIA